jgi:hypothetical protein
MTQGLIEKSGRIESGFFLNNYSELASLLEILKARNENQEKALLEIKDAVERDAAVTALDIVPIIYDPYSPVLVNPNSATRGPMHSLSYSYSPEDSNSFEYLAGNKGTIFIYKSISQADGEKEIGL